MQKLLGFLRREKVFAIALAAALISMLLVPPDGAYAGYIDVDVLMLLFSLMAVVAGFQKCGVFDRVSRALLTKSGNLRRLTVLLTLACFFFSMLVTNDVALLTFVPLTAALLGFWPEVLIYAVSLETVAANLGSMGTPIGNPQNLYLFSHYDMPIDRFFAAVLPLTAASLALVLLACLPVRPRELRAKEGGAPQPLSGKMLALYSVLFALCLLCVLKVMPKWVCFASVLALLLIVDREPLKRVDYVLLATFACFFVFVGNLGRIDAVSTALMRVIGGRELEVGILASQVISNVPAALMLSGFTQNAAQLLRGVDVGGLGTLVASLASLISFKLYLKTENAKAGRYLAVFTGMNLVFLAALYALCRVL